MRLYRNYQFKNWARNIQIKVPYFYQPENLEELIDIIKKHSNIRIIGSGHSWSHLWHSADTIIDLSFLTFEPSMDKKTLIASLPAGMKLWHINQFLDQNGLALQNLGSIDQQSIAGAIVTGTHGSGLHFGCLATQCTEFTFVDGHGTIHTLDKNHPHFYGALVSFGLLGVITQLRIQTVPAYQIQENTFTCSWQQAIEELENWSINYDHVKLWWLPPSPELVVYGMKRTQNPIQESPFQHLWREKVLSVWFYRLFVIIGNIYPALRPKINQFLTSQMRKPYQRTNKSYKIFKVAEPPKHRETEWAFPLKNHLEILKKYFHRYSRSRFTFNFIQEIRISKADNFWLSPSYGRDTLWIGLYNHYDKQWKDMLSDFQTFALELDGRPHWGKEFDAQTIPFNTLYPKWNDFMELKKLYDPLNKWGKFPFYMIG